MAAEKPLPAAAAGTSDAACLTLLDGGDSRCISRWTTDTEFFQLMNEAGLRIALRSLCETLCSLYLASRQFLTFLERWQDMGELVLLFLIVNRLTIDLDETVELHHFTLSNKLL